MYLKKIVHIKGAFFEMLAANLLRLKGYRILARNQKFDGVEVDILAAAHRTLVITEVKYRQSRQRGHEALHPKQRQRLYRQAQQLASTGTYFEDVRIDVVLFFPHRPFVQHIKNAGLGQV